MTMKDLTWEQKLASLRVLTDTVLRMRKPGDWYVSASGRDISGDGLYGMLRGVYGNGSTPGDAVEDDYQEYYVVKEEFDL